MTTSIGNITKFNHPAKYSDSLLPVMAEMLAGCERILDPFAGVGKIFCLMEYLPLPLEIEAIEIEPEWAIQHPGTKLGTVFDLPWSNGYFDAICTSPTYGNRMADRWSSCTTKPIGKYAWELQRELHPDNSGSLHWGDSYRKFHETAYVEISRVLKSGGLFVLNMKDHIRKKERMYVTDWHISTLKSLGYREIRHEKIDTPSFGYGQNAKARVPYESLILLIKEVA